MPLLHFSGIGLAVGARSDTGMRRAGNEDSFTAAGPAFVVADGMGGYEHGDRASAAVVGAFEDRLRDAPLASFDAIQDALLDADDRVAVVSAGTSRGAGSTATGIALVAHERTPYWLVFNVGDSRVYRLSGGELRQVTKDHSLGRELVDAGQLDPADLPTFKDRNVITRAIGAMDSLADSLLVPVQVGDRFLLCSDGLHGEVPDAQLTTALTGTDSVETIAAGLVDAANAAGGRDNITVVVVEVTSVDVGEDWERAVDATTDDDHDDTQEV